MQGVLLLNTSLTVEVRALSQRHRVNHAHNQPVVHMQRAANDAYLYAGSQSKFTFEEGLGDIHRNCDFVSE